MDDSHITAADQFEAALAEQRVLRKQKLLRLANPRKRIMWAYIGFGVAAILFVLAYSQDRHWSSLSGLIMIAMMAVVTQGQVEKKRREAERLLKEEFPEHVA
jgi:hypothetical protein